MKTIIVVIAILVALCAAHPTHYPEVDPQVCYLPEPAKIYSWHIHLIYWQTHKEHKEGAYRVRQHLFEHFNLTKGPECEDLFHQDYTCTFEVEDDPAGPFVTGQWSIFVVNEDFEKYVPWIVQNREGYDILVHPNSGCEVEDHTSWALWAGQPWEIDATIFGHNEPWPWADETVKSSGSMIVLPADKHDTVLVNKFLEERRI